MPCLILVAASGLLALPVVALAADSPRESAREEPFVVEVAPESEAPAEETT